MQLWTKGFQYSTVAAVAGLPILTSAPLSRAQDVPKYKYDGSWPKLPLPNGWTVEGVTGMYLDKDDHIWVLHRPHDFDLDKTENFAALNPPVAECCARNLLRSWGGPDSDPNWAVSHTILVDSKGTVWLAAPSMVMRYTSDGFISSLGERQTLPLHQQPQNNPSHSLAGQPAAFALDEESHELHIADGYVNKRVVVWDSETGEFNRAWGAYGVSIDQLDNNSAPPHGPNAPLAKNFRNPVHCIKISYDGLVYVCDRGGDRIQVFTQQSKFVRNFSS